MKNIDGRSFQLDPDERQYESKIGREVVLGIIFKITFKLKVIGSHAMMLCTAAATNVA